LIVVPLAEVEHVSPEDECVYLHRDPRPCHRFALRALVAQVLRTGTIP
jgi:hypothetical protein